MQQSYNPFRLKLKPAWLGRVIEKVLALNSLAETYDNRPNTQVEKPHEHLNEFLEYLEIALNNKMDILNPDALTEIPSSGPVIFVANHPFGGLEGVAMSHLLRSVRPDLKVLTNEMLTTIPEFKELFIGVDVLSVNAKAKNARGIRQTMKHVKSGGALLIFPAGKVSALNVRTRKVEDQPWNNLVGTLMKQYQASCVPFFINGRNSKLFYAAGLIHPRLRTALLPRELNNGSAKTPQLSVGSTISWRDVQGLTTPDEITTYLRTACDLLQHHETEKNPNNSFPLMALAERSDQEIATLNSDLEQLEPYKLLSYNNFDVYCAPYDSLNSLMLELAVARERAFRAAGEGTGLEADSDRFDPHYLHLFLWDRDESKLVGGYRVGETQKIVNEKGVEGLYSRSLYNFDAQYISRYADRDG